MAANSSTTNTISGRPKPPRRFATTQSDRLYVRLTNTEETPVRDVEFEKDDIVKSVLVREAQYIAQQTQRQNEYPLRSVTDSNFSFFKMNDENGNPVPLSPNGGGDPEKLFIDSSAPAAASAFNATSNSGQLDIDSAAFKIKKGKSSDDLPTGKELLTALDLDGSESPIAQRIQTVLEQNNQYNDANRFIPQIGVKENDSNIVIGRIQRELGKHNPRKFPSNLPEEEGDLIRLKDLKQLGAFIMLNASGEVIKPAKAGTTEVLISTHVPGIARLGQKVPVNRFSAIEAYKQINPSFSKPSTNSFLNEGSVLSYGNVNNYAASFSGTNSSASLTLAILLSLTVGALLKGVAALGDGPQTPDPNDYGDRDYRKRRLGAYFPVDESNPADSITPTWKKFGFSLNLHRTKHPYLACVSRGINVFFGLSKEEGTFADAGTLLSNTANMFSTMMGGQATNNLGKIHGYYNTILRAIIRSASNFVVPGVTAIKNFNTVSAGNTEAQVDNAITAGNMLNPWNIAKKMNESVLLQFLNILAQIGDIALTREDLGVSTSLSIIDSIPESVDFANSYNPAILQAKGRLNDLNGSLAYKNSSIKSMFLLPPSLTSAALRYSSEKALQLQDYFAEANTDPTQISSGTPKDGDVVVLGNNDMVDGKRIKADIVRQMEEYLERDYMPFYFHDLRTNEIIAFHAFVDSVSDNYDAEYSEGDSFGRVGKTMIYKNTNRSISLAFKVLATNPKDFDEMWVKVNKLVTLVYPQWTKGREIKWGQNKFVQPFSQIPSSSPIIRLRLGDLFKSNYSKFAVARLFGFSMDANEFSLERLDRTNNSAQSFQSQTRIRNNINSTLEQMRAGNYSVGSRALLKPNIGSTLDGNPPYYRHPEQPAITHRIPTPTIPVGRASTRQRTPNPNRLVVHYKSEVRIVQPYTRQNAEGYLVDFVNPTDEQGGTWFVPRNCLEPNTPYIIRQASQSIQTNSSTTNETSQTAVDEFLSNNNPIFKSFSTTEGVGLAGVIKSLKFDFENARWETDRMNARAPTLITVQMEFAPIHDLQPGIDHDGFNIAPIYNIGDAMSNICFDDKNTFDTKVRNFNVARSALGRIR